MPRILSRKIAVLILLAMPLVFLLIQLVPVPQRNPPIESEVPASAEVRTVLRRACYDCHSNETVWPWYSRVAPMSWLIAFDVYQGREELNFSTWHRLSVQQQDKALAESWEKVAEGEMPPWYYRLLHREAALSPAEQTVLRSWALGMRSHSTVFPVSFTQKKSL